MTMSWELSFSNL